MADIFGMEVTGCARVSECLNSYGRTRHEFKSGVDEQFASGLNQFGEMGKTFEVSFFCAIDVKVVRICGGYYSYIGSEPVERAVVFVSFDN